MSNNNLNISFHDWIDKADDELLYVKAGFRETKIPHITCFSCQQIAEKYLKGFLVAHNTRPKRTHVLPDLLKECMAIDKDFSEIKEECNFLDQFYNPARYPDDTPVVFSEDNAKQAIKNVERVINFIQVKIKE